MSFDARQTRELTEALAFLMGDMSAWPIRCGRCESENVEPWPVRDTYVCLDCKCETTRHVAFEDQVARAKAHLRQGVGGPLVDAFARDRGKA